MEIKSQIEGSKLVVSLVGMLDTVTSPELQSFLDANLDGVKELVIDLEKLEYISSAGLRTILAAAKKMKEVGSMEIVHVNDTVNEIFQMTGFSKVLNIK